MNRFIVLPIIVIIMLLLSFAPAGNWTKYISKEGHYSIEFPGKPSETTKEDTSAGHKPYTIHYATWFPSDSGGYMTSWIDLRKNYPKNKTIKQMLEECRDDATNSVSANNVITTAIMTGKEPYIAFAFTSHIFAGRGRIYIINKFQYSVITLFSINSGISPDADRFIRSFKYLP